MQLVNWQGALIGPGSEWFWAAAQFVVVVVSLFGIYRQLRSQGAANFVQRIETLEGEWNSSRLTHARLALALHLKYEPLDLAAWFKAQPVLDFFMNLANLNEAGYLNLDEIAATWGRSIQIYAALTVPLVEHQAAHGGDPTAYNLTGLITRLRADERKRGVEPLTLDDETLPALLDYAIAVNTAKLEQAAAWQSGAIPRAPSAATA